MWWIILAIWIFLLVSPKATQENKYRYSLLDNLLEWAGRKKQKEYVQNSRKRNAPTNASR